MYFAGFIFALSKKDHDIISQKFTLIISTLLREYQLLWNILMSHIILIIQLFLLLCTRAPDSDSESFISLCPEGTEKIKINVHVYVYALFHKK